MCEGIRPSEALSTTWSKLCAQRATIEELAEALKVDPSEIFVEDDGL